jgi:hypothetical protein
MLDARLPQPLWWADLCQPTWSVSGDPYAYRLLLSFVAVNLLGAALMAAAFAQGWITVLLATDSSGLVRLIMLVFVIGFGWCVGEVVQISQELNAVRSARPRASSETGRFLVKVRCAQRDDRSSLEKAMHERLAARLTPIHHIGGALVLLGLIGTVVGFVMALAAVDPAVVSEVSSVAPMIARLIEGLGVALHTTLVGAVLNIWLMLDYRIVESGMSRLYVGLLERGARDE